MNNILDDCWNFYGPMTLEQQVAALRFSNNAYKRLYEASRKGKLVKECELNAKIAALQNDLKDAADSYHALLKQCDEIHNSREEWKDFGINMQRDRDELLASGMDYDDLLEKFNTLEREHNAVVIDRNGWKQLASEQELDLIDYEKELKELRESKTCSYKKEYDEAVRACHIWQEGHKKIVEERDKWMRISAELEQRCEKLTIDRDNWEEKAKYANLQLEVANEFYDDLEKFSKEQRKRLDAAYKQIYRQLIILQENGLSEYGN